MSSREEEALETLPLRAAQRIVRYIHEQSGYDQVTVDQVFSVLANAIGPDAMNNNADVRELSRKQRVNDTMDFEYSDSPEQLVLTNVALNKNKDIQKVGQTNYQRYINDLVSGEEEKSGTRRFDQSRREYSDHLKSQHDLLGLFNKNKKNIDPSDHEMSGPIRLIYDEEKPTPKDIEKYRGERDEELTDADRALQQAESYMNKFKNYFKHVEGIKNLSQIPSKPERAMMLQNFYKYLLIKYPIQPYKGLFVPVERRSEKDTYHYGDRVDEFPPLREMILQDFRDRVKQGKAPSLDLGGALPTLAMYHARTTFVPPLTQSEMNKIFYPAIRPSNKEPFVQLPKYKHKDKEKDILIVGDDRLNNFQSKYLTRSYQSVHSNNCFACFYDDATNRYIEFTSEQFLDKVYRLLYLLDDVQQNECLLLSQPADQCSAPHQFLLFACFSLISGVPFVICEDPVAALNQFDVSYVCSNNDFQTTQLSNHLSNNPTLVKNVIYCGHNEPMPTNLPMKGSAVKSDPISQILKPTVAASTVARFDSAMYDYLPISKKVLKFKEFIVSGKGVTDDDLEQARRGAYEKSMSWNKNDGGKTIAYIKHCPDGLFRAVLHEELDFLFVKLQQCMEELINRVKSEPSIQILIGLPSNHPTFYFFVLFCIKLNLSFMVTNPSNIHDHIINKQPAVLIANTADTLKCLKSEFRRSNVVKSETVLERSDPSSLDFSYSGLIGKEGLLQSKMLQYIRSTVNKTSTGHNLTGIISVGPTPPHYSKHKCKWFHITHSFNTLSPLNCIDMSKYAPNTIYNNFDMGWNITTQNDGTVEVNSNNTPHECILNNNNNKIISDDKINLQDESRWDMPSEVKSSLQKLKLLQSETNFYKQVLRALQNKQEKENDSFELSQDEKELFGALLQELESIIPKVIDVVTFSNIEDFLNARIELTNESKNLQDLDYQYKFIEANKNGQIKSVLKERENNINIKYHEKIVLDDVVVHHNTLTPKYCIRDLCNQKLDVELLQNLFVVNGPVYLTYCFLSTNKVVLFVNNKTVSRKEYENLLVKVCSAYCACTRTKNKIKIPDFDVVKQVNHVVVHDVMTIHGNFDEEKIKFLFGYGYRSGEYKSKL
ncbi:hypothetical protein AKO1_014471 [Acrasis kona]|uniref:Uncharacterized protein n=1 Tax=Acrasis kona TaxID=1008807 RepID=A0AAW2YZF3_9EUKA